MSATKDRSYGPKTYRDRGGDRIVISTDGDSPGLIEDDGGTYSGTTLYVPCGFDLILAASAGDNDPSDAKYLAAQMGVVRGANLTKIANFIAGIIGKYSVSGAKSTTFHTGGVVGEAAGRCDGAVVAVLGSEDSLLAGEAQPIAMFKVVIDNDNHKAGAGTAKPQFGLDLYDSRNGLGELRYSKADLRLSQKVVTIVGSGEPQNSVTGANEAELGSEYVDIATGKRYFNKGSLANPTWKEVTTAA